jgi:hypothetical protein
MGRERALFRVADLIRLADMVEELSRERRRRDPDQCKDISAATVRPFMPREGRDAP